MSLRLCREGSRRGWRNYTPSRLYIFKFHTRQRFLKVKALISRRVHVEVARGKPSVNKTYCTKEGDYFEQGCMVNQGQRNDLSRMKDDSLHMSAEDLLERYGERWIRYRKSIKEHIVDETHDQALQNMQEAFKPDDVRLRPWQRTCLLMLERQTDREILFVVDPEGNNGNTWLRNLSELTKMGFT